MKRILLFLSALFIATTAIARTINWYVDGSVYHTTTCESGDNVTPPTAPEKYGYTFQSWLPYIPVQYIESTGTQLIDILYKPTLKDRLEIDYQFLSNGTVGCSRFDIAQTSTYTTSPYGWCVITGTPYQRHYYDFDMPNKKVYRDSKSICPDNASFYAGCSVSYTLFSNHSARFYSLKLWNNNILIRDIIPVLDQNGIVCIYDKIEDKYYYNKGTGNFIAGPIVGE